MRTKRGVSTTRRAPGPQAKRTAAKRRAERKVAAEVREAVELRDGYCRLHPHDATLRRVLWGLFGPCGGASEWAHLGDARRFKTRGMAPEARHSRMGSLKLCAAHHRT
ncbi:MAG TPA: hypothetical protein VFN64_07080, partial [Burkholderiaceae bacterium]|nr:hypothetical protein [Burkholderiaceae bacterium]